MTHMYQRLRLLAIYYVLIVLCERCADVEKNVGHYIVTTTELSFAVVNKNVWLKQQHTFCELYYNTNRYNRQWLQCTDCITKPLTSKRVLEC